MSPSTAPAVKPDAGDSSSIIGELKSKLKAVAGSERSDEVAEMEQEQEQATEYEHLTRVPIVKQRPISDRLQPELAQHYSPHLSGLQEYKQLYKQSIESPGKFFGDKARQFLNWFKDFDSVFVPNPETGKPSLENNAWFLNGQLNAAYNCVDRHALQTPNKPAIIYEADEPGQGYTLTYAELLEQVCKVAQVLQYSMGVRKGDTVAVYMPMIPQTLITLMAITRIGAIHSVVFAGFSCNSLRDRINDADSRVVITTDESKRGGKIVETKRIVDDAIKETSGVRNVLVYKRTNNPKVQLVPGRDLDWDDEIKKYKGYCPCEPVDSEHPLFLLYTSGSTGTPKGVQHSTAGYLLGALLTMRYTFDTHREDVFFTAGDVGWITGHTYVVYGPLLYGCTTLVFEGTPAYPNYSRYWDIVDKYKVTQFYVAPTALRLLKRAGDSYVENHSLKSLRCLGTVGEPIAAEVWDWYSEQIGKNEIPIVDTYWQTESGSHMLTPLAGGVTPMKPGSACFPFFGIEPAILDANTGKEITASHAEGVLAVKSGWPSFARTIWKNHDRFLDTYLKPFKGYYFAGDGAARDKDGYMWILGRVDDVVNVSGHRLSTAEIESAILDDSIVAECAVVGFNDDLTGQAVAAFVVLKNKSSWSTASESELQDIKKHLILAVRKDIGPFAAPKLIVLVDDLPKTRSGKIMRRILRKILAGESDQLGDVSTLSNPGIVRHLIDSVKL
ncbi:probable Acetyl-coenzyme A synthetase 1 [Zygosaccharomyces bailii]|uniref:Acetyl-coenzyme A synthetase n=1 Tax=Zygosaccharomyces bailii (strain CLIB 213 / ATCC 58445 / CBS 680 / BCRC 21525 / NBRC 1098 / NCYC 1416 / NRRL Y-2227) TaxID=1333698 RepID=A0A8J2T8C3_ZYGB2|nr:ZYBA0S07-05776g1_1 [Zygosaccharomyces bailii CLIB 213]SJM84313.1 probable Acetyl-coenzyme A synthetase 1 [Zygosaccharomyces bailii]